MKLSLFCLISIQIHILPAIIITHITHIKKMSFWSSGYLKSILQVNKLIINLIIIVFYIASSNAKMW